MKVGVLKAAGFSRADIMKRTGATVTQVKLATERLEACVPRLEAA